MTFTDRAATIRAIAMAGAMIVAVAPASAAAQTHSYNIAPTTLSNALKALGRTSGHHLLFQEDMVRDKLAPALKGNFSVDDALSRLLQGSNLHAQRMPNGSILIRLMAANPAAAQSGAMEDNAPVVSDIVVTAQRRTERLIEVPVAVSAIQGNVIDDQGLHNVEDIQTLVPALSLQRQGTSGNSSLFLRGIGTISFSTGNEPSVSTVIDGVVMARSGQAFGDVYDVERIEVLRGPQGTLFGKNASAGVINIITKRPTREFEASFLAEAYTGNEFRLRASSSGPLSDAVRARITGFVGKFDGNFTNLYYNKKVNGYDRRGVRGVVEADVTDRLTVTVIGDWAKGDDECCVGARAQSDGGILDATTGIVPRNIGNGVDANIRVVNEDLISRGDDEVYGISMQADQQVGDGTLTSITAYRTWKNVEVRDGDFSPTQQNPLRPVYINTVFTHDSGTEKWRQFSQELRYASPTGGAFDYQIGAMYWTALSDRTFTRESGRCNAFAPGTVVANLPRDATGYQPCTGAAVRPTYAAATAVFGSEFRNLSAFGQATYHFTPKLSVTGGLRYTNDRVSFDYTLTNTTGNVVGPGVLVTAIPLLNSTTSNNLSGKISIGFMPSRDFNTYISYTRGYKGPAFNLFYNLGTNDPALAAIRRLPISPETVDSFEIGAKGALLNGRLTFGIAAFYAKYYNYQADNRIFIDGINTTFFTNAGETSTRGVELDFRLQPTRDFAVFGGVAYADAQVDDFTPPPGATGAATSLPGQALPFAPKFKGAITGENRFRTSLPVDFIVGTTATFEGVKYATFGEPVDARIRDYVLWNASLAIVDQRDRFKLAFLVKNILDQSYYTGIAGGQGGIRIRIPRNADRYAGVQLSGKF